MRHRHTGRSRLALPALFALSGSVLAGCDGIKLPSPPPSPGLAECGASNVFRGRNFSNPTKIDNKWLPLIPEPLYA